MKFLIACTIVILLMWVVLLFFGDGGINVILCVVGILSMTLLLFSTVKSYKSIKASRFQDIYFAGGCFWGTEKYFKLIKGVVSTEVGYANGNTENPTYEQVYTDTTGYAECVHVRYDTEITTLRKLTELYFKAIDPTSVNKQGEDEGTRYRTGVYFQNPQVEAVLKLIFEEQSVIYGKLAVELLPLNNFVRAEDYHQDYLDKNPDGYCHLSNDLFEYAKRN